MQRYFNGALVAMTVTAVSMAPALARGNDLIIKDGFGEEVTVKHGFFGHDTKIVKDRLGDGYAQKKGWFGAKEQDVNMLGNSFSRKTGILGGTDLKGTTIFGDKVQTKKGVFGRRTTTIDVSGGASAIKALWDQNKDKIMGTSSMTPLGGAGAAPLNNGALQTPPSDPSSGSPTN